MKANELEKAKTEIFVEAYDIKFRISNLLFDLGYLEYLNGENQLALEYYTKASKLNSRNPTTLCKSG